MTPRSGVSQTAENCKFIRDEATAFSERLQAESEGTSEEESTPPVRLSAAEQAIRGISGEQLAAELQRASGIVIEP